MRNDELESDLKQLSEEEREEADYLLRLARVRKDTKPSNTEIEKRSKEKNISFAEARRELINEAQKLRGDIVSGVGKLLKPRLSKNVRRKLGIKSSGRPRGSKNINRPMSKTEFCKKLKDLIKSNNQIGIETKEEDAAKVVNLGGARQLRRKLREYGDKRRWKELVQDLLAE